MAKSVLCVMNPVSSSPEHNFSRTEAKGASGVRDTTPPSSTFPAIGVNSLTRHKRFSIEFQSRSLRSVLSMQLLPRSVLCEVRRNANKKYRKVLGNHRGQSQESRMELRLYLKRGSRGTAILGCRRRARGRWTLHRPCGRIADCVCGTGICQSRRSIR